MFCKNCGQQLEENATVCSACGHETGVQQKSAEEVGYCKVCGKQINPNKTFCPYCGAEKGAEPQPAPQPAPAATYATNPQPAVQDAPSMGYAVLGFFFPIIGFILWLIWKDQTPLKAKSCGKGALISVIINVVGTILIYVLYFLLVLIGLSASATPLLLL